MRTKKYDLVLVEWIDITSFIDKNPFLYPTKEECCKFYQPAIKIKTYIDSSEVEVVRYCTKLGKRVEDRPNSDFIDIPKSNIVSERKLDKIDIIEEE